jgi:hypothetical protein
MGYLKDRVHERMVDTCEVDAATRINDFNFSCYTLYCETSVELKVDILTIFTAVKLQSI